MRKALQWGIAALAVVAVAAPVGGTAAPAATIPVIEHAGYTFCANEANDAMSLGRLVMVFKRTREQVGNDPSLPPYIRGMAADLFQSIDAGKAPTYAHFAAARFRQCLATQQVPLEVGEGAAFACVTRLDIPYYFRLMARAGESRETAVAKLQQALAGWQYPDGLIAVMAEPAFKARSGEEVRQLQVFLLSSCLLPPEQVARFYGAPAPGGAGKAAPAPKAAPAKPAPASPAKPATPAKPAAAGAGQ